MESKMFTTAALEALENGNLREALTHIIAAIESLASDVAAIEFMPMGEVVDVAGIDDGIYDRFVG